MSRRHCSIPPAGDPAVRARAMVHSMRAYGLAWLGWLPLVGVIFCVHSLRTSARARREIAGHWNPAGGYLKAASWIARTALLVWVVVLGLVLLAILGSLG
ncbi:MAG: hypothetical protein J0L84_06050 [Verrucomicrobia bacterium]|nr:hypothetical protein [Verrucomicrobiota bacterium]